MAAPKTPAPRAKATYQPKDSDLGTLPDGVGLDVGLPLPDIALPNANDRPVSLRELASRGTLLLV